MSIVINGIEKETDNYGYLLEPDFSDEAVLAFAAQEGIVLTDPHWIIIRYLRQTFQEEGHTPNARNLIKGLQEDDLLPEADNKLMFDLFPDGGAAKQGCRVAGLPQPIGKGGY